MSTLTEIPNEDAFHSHTSALPSTALLVISFHAPWAAPCAQMRTLLETLASTYPATSEPSISFVSLSAEDLPDISEAYDVTAVPFLVLQRDGKVLEKISGCDAARIRNAVEKHHVSGNQKGAELPPLLQKDPEAVRRAEEAAALAQRSGAANGKTTGVNGGGAATENGTAGETPVSQEELNARLEGLVKAAPVMLFMKGTPSEPQCGFSRKLVGMLREGGVRYGFFNILADEDVRQGLKVWADWPTFPQLWVGGELVGGLDIVQEELESNPDFFAEYSVHKKSALPEAEKASATVA